jgi:heterotetrameric sarcosine oxidase delta subunit
MPFLVRCPHCGPREATEYVYGGELTERPTERPERRDLNLYLYERENTAGLQREWWFHAAGCNRWLVVERDTVTNEVHGVATAETGAPERAGVAEDAPPAAGAGEVL